MISAGAAAILISVFAGETIELPLDPRGGFAIGEGRLVYLARRTGGEVKVVRFEREGSKLKESFIYPGKFVGVLELLAVKDGVVVVDYETGAVVKYGRDGRIRWSAKVRFPNAARLDSHDNVWFFFNSGTLGWKTPDSSEVEPILGPYGEILESPVLSDLAPHADGSFYALRSEGGLLFYDSNHRPKIIHEGITGVRLILSKLGGVLVFQDGDPQRIVHVSATGKVTQVWTATADMRGIRYLNRLADGSLIVAAPKPGDRGIARIFNAGGKF